MKRLRRAVAAGVLGALLALAMGASPAPLGSVPVAQAAGVKLYVDDGPANNGSVRCPDGAHPSLQAAQTALGTTTTNVTITVCPGYYPAAINQVTFENFTNLKLIGKGGPRIDATNFSGMLFAVSNSSKVTISGFNINGGADLGAGDTMAINFANSSGTIKGNVISDWHKDYYAPLTAADSGIVVTATDPGHKVTITGNTVFDAQSLGIVHYGPSRAKITRNQVVMHSDIEPYDLFGSGPTVQAGILLLQAAPGSQVSGNVVESNAGLEPFPCPGMCGGLSPVSRGVMLLETSGAKVTGNRISHTLYGISAESWCFTTGTTDAYADGNTISGNRLYDNLAGVYVHSRNYYGTSCVPHADTNNIKGNRFDRNTVTSFLGVYFSTNGAGTAAANKLIGNTFTGFFFTPGSMVLEQSGAGVTDLDVRSNKVSDMPMAGPLR